MIKKESTLLEIVEDHPEREALIREYDKVAGVCLLCANLFDSIKAIEEQYDLDLNELVQRLNSNTEQV